MIPATANAPFHNLLLSLEMESTETAELVDDSAIPQNPMHTTTTHCGDPHLGDLTPTSNFEAGM